VPASLAAAALVEVDVPGAAWLLAPGPIRLSVASFPQLDGYSQRTAGTGLVLSLAAASAFLPIA
jgi:hypothetical protein